MFPQVHLTFLLGLVYGRQYKYEESKDVLVGTLNAINMARRNEHLASTSGQTRCTTTNNNNEQGPASASSKTWKLNVTSCSVLEEPSTLMNEAADGNINNYHIENKSPGRSFRILGSPACASEFGGNLNMRGNEELLGGMASELLDRETRLSVKYLVWN